MLNSIHPDGQPRARLLRKAKNHTENMAERSEANRKRSSSMSNPTWHGIGRHAGFSHNRKTKVKGGRHHVRNATSSS